MEKALISPNVIKETGLQVVTRLIDRPSLEDLDNDLFFNKLGNTDIIEMKGAISCGLSLLLTKLIAKSILPMKYNGMNTDVLLINTENQFLVSQLFNTLKSEITDFEGPINVDSIAKGLLSNVTMINCYDSNQLFVNINSLDNILLNHKKVGLIIIDSINTYYWQKVDDKLSYNSHVMKMLGIVKKVSTEFKVVTLYTKQFNFESKKQTLEWLEYKKSLRYVITLHKNEGSDELICDIESGGDKKQLCYKLCDSSIVWIEKKQ